MFRKAIADDGDGDDAAQELRNGFGAMLLNDDTLYSTGQMQALLCTLDPDEFGCVSDSICTLLA